MDLDPPFSSSNLDNEHHQTLPFHGNDNIRNNTDLLLSVLVHSEETKAKIHNLAVAASEELQQLALEKEPLWLTDKDGKTDVLNNANYNSRFACLDPTLEEVIRVISTEGSMELPEFNENAETPSGSRSLSRSSGKSEFSSVEIEASRAIGFVSVDPGRLVNMIMDVEHWSNAFSSIVARASNLGILSGDLGNPHEILQVVTAELHFPSPLVRTRELCFARYCRQLISHSWLVVDVSLESIFPYLASRCRRRPSGCIIEALNSCSSKVIWVENNALYDGSLCGLLRPISALGFGAKRWVATLEREYERTYVFEDQVIPSKRKKKTGDCWTGLRPGHKSLLKLAERMLRSFNANVSSYSENSWSSLPMSGAEDILLKTTLNMDGSGAPPGVSITISTSIRLQKPQKDVFELLRCPHERDKWDVLSRRRVSEEVEHVCLGPDPANRLSLLSSKPISEDKAEESAKVAEILYLQETLSDSMGFYVVYSPLDVAAKDHLMAGNDPDIVCILPCGFVVLPDSDPGSSILTLAFEVMDENLSPQEEQIPPLSVSTAHGIIKVTVDLIKAAISTFR